MSANRSSMGRRRRRKTRLAALTPIPSYRLKLVFLILSLGLTALLVRVASLQVFQSDDLETRARSIQTENKKPLGTRRSILDRNGRLIAIDEERFRLWAHPRYFSFPGDLSEGRRKPYEIAEKISSLISRPVSEIVATLEGRSSGVRLAESLDSEVANKLKRLRISGLDLEAYPQRVYPQGSLFANVVGFLNHDRFPQAGLEFSLNNQLMRQEKTSTLRRGADGTPLPDGIKAGTFFRDDVDLHLTLDARLQEVAVKALSKQVHKWQAKKGVVIVMNVQNGELLALASTPTYDPNRYWKYSTALFKEWSVQDLFEPGSTFKPINLALALEEGVINPDGTVEDNGLINVGGWPLSNWDRKPNGTLNYPEVLQVSSNVAMVNIMRNLDPASYWEWLRLLEIDKSPETDLPGAVAGQLKSKAVFTRQPIEPAVASFGQGFSITPLKLVQLHALIANGGKMVTPHITRGFPEKVGDVIKGESDTNNQVLRPDVAKTVLEWMETVVEKGSGKGSKVKGYRIAGKTGTAQKAQNGSYYNGRICSFVASLPVENPRYVVLVVVDEPQRAYSYGSTVAVPVAKDIIESLLVLEKIPPSTTSNDL